MIRDCFRKRFCVSVVLAVVIESWVGVWILGLGRRGWKVMKDEVGWVMWCNVCV